MTRLEGQVRVKLSCNKCKSNAQTGRSMIDCNILLHNGHVNPYTVNALKFQTIFSKFSTKILVIGARSSQNVCQ